MPNKYQFFLFFHLLFVLSLWAVAPFFPDETATLINIARALPDDFIRYGNWPTCDFKEINYVFFIPAFFLSLLNNLSSYLGLRFIVIFSYLLLIFLIFNLLEENRKSIFLFLANISFSGVLGYSIIMFRPEFFILINFYFVFFLSVLLFNNKQLRGNQQILFTFLLIMFTLFSAYVHKMGLFLIFINLIYLLFLQHSKIIKILISLLSIILFIVTYNYHQIRCDSFPNIVNFLEPMTANISDYLNNPAIIIPKFLKLISSFGYLEQYTINYLPKTGLSVLHLFFNLIIKSIFIFSIFSIFLLFYIYMRDIGKKNTGIYSFVLFSLSSIIFLIGIFLGDSGTLFYRSPLYYHLVLLNLMIFLILYEKKI